MLPPVVPLAEIHATHTAAAISETGGAQSALAGIRYVYSDFFNGLLSDGFGACTHTLNTRPCSDGNDCTVDDVCTGGQCVPGEFTVPWINEIDYDDQSEGAGTHDNDEFIEIAGPSGMDISNYWLVSVEGGGSGCNTPLFYNVGVVHWTAQIPAGTVLKGGTCVGGGNDGYRRRRGTSPSPWTRTSCSRRSASC